MPFCHATAETAVPAAAPDKFAPPGHIPALRCLKLINCSTDTVVVLLNYKNVNNIIKQGGPRVALHNSIISRVAIMKFIPLIAITASFLVTGCASVNMASKDDSAKAKQFAAPAAPNAGLYVYRNSFVGKALKKDIWIDGKCLGESAPDVFFYTEVDGGKNIKVSTESEFSPNDLILNIESGKNYFVRQYIKMGVLVGGAGVEQISEQQGKTDIAPLEMAIAGNCSVKK